MCPTQSTNWTQVATKIKFNLAWSLGPAIFMHLFESKKWKWISTPCGPSFFRGVARNAQPVSSHISFDVNRKHFYIEPSFDVSNFLDRNFIRPFHSKVDNAIFFVWLTVIYWCQTFPEHGALFNWKHDCYLENVRAMKWLIKRPGKCIRVSTCTNSKCMTCFSGISLIKKNIQKRDTVYSIHVRSAEIALKTGD